MVNHTAQDVATFIPLAGTVANAVILDPLSRKAGAAITRDRAGKTEVKVQIASGDALILKTNVSEIIQPWEYAEATATGILLESDWEITFEEGGPVLPESAKLQTLKSWTSLGEDAEHFSGTARYTTTFEKPSQEADAWRLDLGDVRESAEVWLNGNYMGTAWSVPYQLNLGQLKNGKNTLTLKVTNLAANRLRAKELRGEEWKTFYEINIVNKDYKPFDAKVWEPTPSGLLGPIELIPLQIETK